MRPKPPKSPVWTLVFDSLPPCHISMEIQTLTGEIAVSEKSIEEQIAELMYVDPARALALHGEKVIRQFRNGRAAFNIVADVGV